MSSPDVVFDLFGQTIAPEEERTPWIDRLIEGTRTAKSNSRSRGPYQEIELPLSPVLVEMEMAGIRIDVSVLERMSREMGTQLDDLTRRICEIADCEFNINSPRQLGEILFDKLNLPRPRKLRKSGQYSTAVEILEELAAQHELPRLVLEYRQLVEIQIDVHRCYSQADRSEDRDVCTRPFIRLRHRPGVSPAAIPICRTFPCAPTLDERFVAHSFRKKDGGSFQRTIHKWNCVFWLTCRMISGSRRRLRPAKTFIDGRRRRCYACRLMQSRPNNASAQKR